MPLRERGWSHHGSQVVLVKSRVLYRSWRSLVVAIGWWAPRILYVARHFPRDQACYTLESCDFVSAPEGIAISGRPIVT